MSNVNLASAIISYRLYDKEGNRYDINKRELKNNKFSNMSPMSGKWSVRKNSGMGTAQVLSTTKGLLHHSVYSSNIGEDLESIFYFDTAELALEALSQNVESDLSF